MPATLGHIALQVPLGRVLRQDIDTKWLLAGCIIPDLPWILQRLAGATGLVAALDLRAYAIAQSALAVSLLFCALLAAFALRPMLIFAVLSIGCLVHLLLDAFQTKWANGVALAAPVSWELTSFGFFWPEDFTSLFLLALGTFVAIRLCWIAPPSGADLVRPGAGRLTLAGICLAAYLVLPVPMMPAVEAANLHGVATLRQVADRPGRAIAFDRNQVTVGPQDTTLAAWTGEQFRLTGAVPAQNGLYSLSGRFISATEVEVLASHRHAGPLRDIASYLGLLFVLLWWAASLWDRIKQPERAGRLATNDGRK